MKYRKEPRSTWQSSEMDTESEANDDQPLLSDASVTSRRSFGATLMFADASETSDVDSGRPPGSNQLLSTQAPQRSSRSPYFLQTMASSLKDSPDETFSRFKYYSKIKNFIKREDSHQHLSDHNVPSSVFVPYIPGSDQLAGKQSSIVTIFAIWNTIMGSSLLAMPWGIDRAGLASGIFIMIIMGAVCLYTSYLLLRVQQLHGGGNVDWEAADLTGYLLGPNYERIAKFFSLIVLIGANIVYWILMSNFLYHSIDYVYGVVSGSENIADPFQPAVVCPRIQNMSWSPNNSLQRNETILLKNKTITDETILYQSIWNLEVTVPIFLVLVIGPLVNFKSATFFTKFNSLGTLSVLYLVCFVIIKSSHWGVNIDFHDTASQLYVDNFKWSFPALTGMLALALFIHNIIVTVMRNNRHQENNGRDLSIAFTLVVITYLTVGVVFFVAFPLKKSCIEDNLLNNFQNWDPLTVAARLFLFFQLVTVYPLIAYMLRVQLFTTLMQKVYPGFRHVLFLNTCIIGTCVCFAIFLPRIGTIIRFTGALSGFIYIFTLPSLLHLASLKKRGKQTILSVILHPAITIFGAANLIAQFFVQEHDVI